MLSEAGADQSINVLMLTYAPFAAQARAHALSLGGFGELRPVSSIVELRELVGQKKWTLLLAFGTGVIVPADVLETPGLVAVNVHAASPDYPGRDPHHFAAYDAVSRYGATMHYMTTAVDQGPIIDVEWFSPPTDAAPCDLLALANQAGLRLVERFLALFDPAAPPSIHAQYHWSPVVRRRADFKALCRVDAQMPAAEFERRARAVAMPGYENLWTELHGRRFVADSAGT